MNDRPALDRIHEMGDQLSPKLHKLGRYITRNPLKAAFMNSVTLAASAGVSDSSVVRLAMALGYKGFPEFQRDLQRQAQKKMTSLEKFTSDSSTVHPLFKAFDLEAAALHDMRENLDPEGLEKAVELLAEKGRILTVGLYANACLAHYAGFFLGLIRSDVATVTTLDPETYGTFKNFGEDAAALVYSFPRYPEGATSIAAYLKERGVTVIGVTDNALSPLAPHCDILFEVPMRYLTFVDPLSASMALTHALLLGLFLRNPEQCRANVEDFEALVSERRFFEQKDLDIVDILVERRKGQ